MTDKTGKILRQGRIISQIAFAALFFFLFFLSGKSATAFSYFDPLISALNFIATGTIISIFLLSLITLILTLIFGRFFCGWICPFGTINHFFSWIFRKHNINNDAQPGKYLKIKYFILVTIIVSALMGTNIGSWLDPLSILTRSASTLTSPFNYLLDHAVKAGADETGIISKGLHPVYNFMHRYILSDTPHFSAQSIIIPGIFIFLIAMNYYRKRFFCNVLCPLGALLGQTARVGIFRLKAATGCTSCGTCSGRCTYGGDPDTNYLKSECMVCFNCVSDCPSEVIETRFELPKKENRSGVDLGRRKLILATLSGLVVASLPKTSIQAKTKVRHSFSRPPGSVKENEFIKICARCGNCVQSCPTSFIQPAFLEAGIEGLCTPVLNASAGSCTWDCNRCTRVCSTLAIGKLTLKDKQAFKIGTAVIDKNRCYTYADGFDCSVCYDHCPTPEKAIRYREAEIINFQGRAVTVKQIYVVPDLCIGCGICENICPRHDAPGIVNTSEDEVRESVTGNI